MGRLQIIPSGVAVEGTYRFSAGDLAGAGATGVRVVVAELGGAVGGGPLPQSGGEDGGGVAPFCHEVSHPHGLLHDESQVQVGTEASVDDAEEVFGLLHDMYSSGALVRDD